MMELPLPSSLQSAWRKLNDWFRRKPERPEDPYAYVDAPTKPRPPHLRMSAVAEPPDPRE